MDRENAEKRVREMEDQLAELQDELRRESGGKTVTQQMPHCHTTTCIQAESKSSFIEYLIYTVC